jgi:hypothetical protein
MKITYSASLLPLRRRTTIDNARGSPGAGPNHTVEQAITSSSIV